MRSSFLWSLLAVAVLLVLLQRTGFAPLPHRYDGFLLGLGVGLAVGAVFSWTIERSISSRRGGRDLID
jgi:hypothetical protein